MIRAQVSLYPIEAADADAVINQSVEALKEQQTLHQVGPVSTSLSGTPDEVWQGLRQMFERAMAQGGEVSLVATVTNAQV